MAINMNANIDVEIVQAIRETCRSTKYCTDDCSAYLTCHKLFSAIAPDAYTIEELLSKLKEDEEV